jgi:hypothetical protein
MDLSLQSQILFHANWLKRWYFWVVFESALLESHVFSQSLQSNTWIILQIRILACSCQHFPIHHSLIILPLDFILSRFMCVTIDGVWIIECIYWPLLHKTRKYKHLQRFTNHHSTFSLFRHAVPSPAVPWQRLLTAVTLQLHALMFCLHNLPHRILRQLNYTTFTMFNKQLNLCVSEWSSYRG